MNIKAITKLEEIIINSNYKYKVEFIDGNNQILESYINGKIIWDFYKNNNILEELDYHIFKNLSKFNNDLNNEKEELKFLVA